MFRDAQDLLFTQDGLSAQLVRAGEPRLAQDDDWVVRRAATVTERRALAPLLRRLLRPALG